MDSGIFCWMPLNYSDLPRLDAIGKVLHPLFPERLEVIEERFNLFPQGFMKLCDKSGQMVGYGIGYPWLLPLIGPIDAFIGTLPKTPDCLYIHDVALLPVAQGKRLAGACIGHMSQVASDLGVECLSLLSVYGTAQAWQRYGFKVIYSEELEAGRAKYGADARYMSCCVKDVSKT